MFKQFWTRPIKCTAIFKKMCKHILLKNIMLEFDNNKNTADYEDRCK